MNIFSRFFRRLKFKRTVKRDESANVVDGMVKAKSLYRKLCMMAHPDRNSGREAIAEELMKRIEANKHNYSELLRLEQEMAVSLPKT